MLKFDEDDFIGIEAFDDSDKEKILIDLSDEVLLESIYEQIEKPVFAQILPSNDYLRSIDERIRFLQIKSKDDPDFVRTLSNIYLEIYQKVLAKINSLFSQNIKFDDTYFINNTRCIYDYFILNYKTFIVNFFKNYILINKEDLVLNIEEKVKKNIEVKSLKRLLRNPKDAYILPYMYDIIDCILGLELTSKDLIDIATDSISDEQYPDSLIRDLFVENDEIIELTDDFIKKVFNDIKHNQENYVFLVSALQTILLEEFPKKKTRKDK